MSTPASIETELGWALGTVTRNYLRVAGSALEEVPGGPKGYLVLSSLGTGQPSTQVALAQHLGVDRTVMTYLLDDLERAGLVERRPDPADRRARRVVLTEAGRARLCDVERRLRRVEEHVLGPLDASERDTLRTLLQRVAIATGDERSDACSVAEEIENNC